MKALYVIRIWLFLNVQTDLYLNTFNFKDCEESALREYDYAHYDMNVSPLTWEKLFGFSPWNEALFLCILV